MLRLKSREDRRWVLFWLSVLFLLPAWIAAIVEIAGQILAYGLYGEPYQRHVESSVYPLLDSLAHFFLITLVLSFPFWLVVLFLILPWMVLDAFSGDSARRSFERIFLLLVLLTPAILLLLAVFRLVPFSIGNWMPD